MATLSDRLKQLQIERSVLKKDIAAAAGLSITGYYRYENGQRYPDVNVLIKLSRFFQCSTDFLLGLSDCPAIQAPAAEEDRVLERAI
ncbi:MAG: helix-turn-helix domain-containing protein [Clostridiales bacterium]|jgi:transcriptional regulator with XRE-family HTH domain|nr:helix-turn-helix domain-containing protein [Clostridiales bacterium]